MIVIRHAELSDSEAIARVLYESFVEYESQYTVAAFAATVLDTNKVRQRLEEGPGWIALSDEEMVGTVSAVSRAEGLYVRGMGVVPRARGFQIGDFLLEEVQIYARANGFEKLLLSTTPFLHRAIRLYEKCGFRFCEEDSDLFGTPLLAMEKELGG